MNKFRRGFFTCIAAFALILGTAGIANAYPSNKVGAHYDFTWAGRDYDFLWSTAPNTSGCVGHIDYYRSRPVLCPLCSWKSELVEHCIIV